MACQPNARTAARQQVETKHLWALPRLWYAWFANANAIQGMNAYGIVLNDIGMDPFIDELQQHVCMLLSCGGGEMEHYVEHIN